MRQVFLTLRASMVFVTEAFRGLTDTIVVASCFAARLVVFVGISFANLSDFQLIHLVRGCLCHHLDRELGHVWYGLLSG